LAFLFSTVSFRSPPPSSFFSSLFFMAQTQQAVKQFLSFSHFAVVGASPDPSKFGNRVLRWYQSHQLAVTPIHPKQDAIEGLKCLKSLSLLPHPRQTAVSIITPPAVTEHVVEDAIKLGIPALWMQPGSHSQKAMKRATEAGLILLANGPCILVDTKSML